MTRVLQAMAGAEHGGAEAFFVRLALALQRAGQDQEVLIRRNLERAEVLSAGGVETVELPFGGRFDFTTNYGFHRAVERYKPQVVLTWMNRATRFCPLIKKSTNSIKPGQSSGLADRHDFRRDVESRKPSKISDHHIVQVAINQMNQATHFFKPIVETFVHVGRLGGYYKIENYKTCDHLIGNTKDIVRYIVESGWPKDRAHYLPNFVTASEAEEPIVRGIYDTPEKMLLILALGRLHKNKGYDTLIRAVAELPHAYLWIAGEGPLRIELEELAVRVGVRPRVRFLGWHQNPSPLFAAADMLVCPSRHEPLGNVVIEGWAHGVPVIATKSAGPGALIRHNHSGLLVPVDEPRALVESIKRLAMDPGLISKIIHGGRKRYEKDFIESVVVARYMRLFKKVAL
jgi:glycosyltransferase involved in cell wall biosynthesis